MIIDNTDAEIENIKKELANANDLLEVSRQHERQLTCHDDAEIVSSAAANVSRLIKSGMTLTQVGSLSFDWLLPAPLCLTEDFASLYDC